MWRPAKRKVEEVETTAEADAEAENDTGLTGAQHLGVALSPSDGGVAPTRPHHQLRFWTEGMPRRARANRGAAH